MKKKHVSLVVLVLLLQIPFSLSLGNNPIPSGLLINSSVRQFTNYDSEWKSVDSLDNLGLPKSAVEIVNKIYILAKKSRNDPQFVKAVIYRVKLFSEFQEDFLTNTIRDLNTEVRVGPEPVKQVMNSLLAEIYWRYYQQNRYRYQDRTKVLQNREDSIQTWDLNTINEKITECYLLSLQNPDALKSIPIADWTAVVEMPDQQGNKSDRFRPTLYDFLAWRALDFFAGNEGPKNQPAFSFSPDDPKLFGTAKDFISLDLNPGNRLPVNSKYQALRLFQELARFHFNNKNPQALIDDELQRFSYLLANAGTENKDTLYLRALRQFEKDYLYSAWSTDITFAIANFLYTSGQQYNPLVSDSHKWDTRDALGLCQDAIKRFPDSEGAKNCRNLAAGITDPSLQVTLEAAVMPEKPFPGLIAFRNVPVAWFRLIKVDPESNQDKIASLSQEEILTYYAGLTPVNSWSLQLPSDGDLQRHSLEFIIPGVPAGYYILLCSAGKDFQGTGKAMVFGGFYSTRISYISQRAGKGGIDVYLLERETGKPLKNVPVESWTKYYDYPSRKYLQKKVNDFTSDENGFISVPPLLTGSNYSGFYLKMKIKEDQYISDNLYQYPYSEKPEKTTLRTFFFTDRAIYRPGQPIYFKGILLEKKGDKFSIAPGQKTTVTFSDANYRKISEQSFVTGEFGSFNGSFVAPQGVLPGQMTISNGSGTASVSVEEYKRPAFEVDFSPMEGNYRLNDTITVTGKALAYAGNNIDGATVNYRVTRNTRYPFYDRSWYMPFPSSPEIEIINGTMKTKADGSFSIRFIAVPDRTVPVKSEPVFDYSVSVDVTDINGETRSGQETVSAGHKSLILGSTLPDMLDPSVDSTFRIIATNLNGRNTPVKVSLAITALRQPDRAFKKRLWERPDLSIISRQEFHSQLPYDIYMDEDNPENWDSENLLEKTVDTRTDSIVNIQVLTKQLAHDRSLKPGMYRLVLKATDPYGVTVVSNTLFTVFDPKSKEVPAEALNWFVPLKTGGEPGEKARFLIGSKEDDVSVIYEIRVHDSLQSRQWLRLSDNEMVVEIPIREEYRGNFSVNFLFVKHNRIFQNSQVVTVPYTNKKLDISYEAFRNKLYPGQEEEWKITIKNAAGKGAEAEFLTAMYDESLDAFAPNNWYFSYLKTWSSVNPWEITGAFKTAGGTYYPLHPPDRNFIGHEYGSLNWFGFTYFGTPSIYRRNNMKYNDRAMPAMEAGMAKGGQEDMTGQPVVSGTVTIEETAKAAESKPKAQPAVPGYQVRRDFRETAFFYPALATDAEGNIVVRFTVPDALTRWKILGFAHTKQLDCGQVEKELVTRKDLMVFPNAPRFVRQGDSVVFSAKVVNLSNRALTGEISVEFLNPVTGQPVRVISSSGQLTSGSGQAITLLTGESISVSWKLQVPVDPEVNVLQYRIVAKAGNFSDAEEKAFPVLSRRIMVTESLPLPVRGAGTFDFNFDKLLQSGSVPEKERTLKNYRLTLEFASNPAWYAVQALPVLDEPKYPNADNIFNAFYANSIASFIANSDPRIKQVFESWKNQNPGALLSNLEKNQDLKSALLRETPWVMEATSESERKQRLSILFDLNTLKSRLDENLQKLEKLQSPNGGWPWFEGMIESRYITQNIITGLGHLDHLGVKNIRNDRETWAMVTNAIKYLDGELVKDYENLKKYNPGKMDENHLGSLQVQYLYARSYFTGDIPVPAATSEAFGYYRHQAEKFWIKNDFYFQGMIALALNRLGNKEIPQMILRSLKEKALHSPESGMYWAYSSGYEWFQAPVETQSLLIEAFDEIAADRNSVDEMKIWLLKQKQTQDWKTGRATAEACYALLLRGMNLLSGTPEVKISVGKEKVEPSKLTDTKVEAGTGYFQVSWNGPEITPEMGKVKVTKSGEGIAWGALYWQYFEDLDKITPHETPLKVTRQLLVEKNTPNGPVLEPVALAQSGPGGENISQGIKIGDRLKVRIVLTVDRNLEFVHMKDLRAAAFEPAGPVLSGYRYQDGLGYYQSTTDVATNFFFDYLPRGTYVFEYPMVVNAAGDYSNGITTAQCMYAPEFSAHSEGIRIAIDK
jgi:hypothetical protein